MTLWLSRSQSVSWWAVGTFMLILGIIGNGIAGHRLIAHRQFVPAMWIRHILNLLCTLSAFAPVWYWRVQHWHHHKYSDQPQDIHSPHTRSLWDSFFGWALKNDYVREVLKTERASMRESLSDPNLSFYLRWNYPVIWAWVIMLAAIDLSMLLSYLVFYWIELVRLGTITSLAHLDLPGSYRNFATDDRSRNHIVLGYLTFGFGWHNNHHAKPMLLDTQVRWWEFDLEAKLAKLIAIIPGARDA